MKSLRTLLSHRIALALLVAAVGIGLYIASMPTTDAVIPPAGPGVWVYYSSGTYTTVVGARGTGCCGEVISWGITTKWKKFERLYCTTGMCPN